MMHSPGTILIELCKVAQSEVILAAPFIKSNAMASVLNAIPEKVTSITCVTRWRPEEVVAGVSDLEVLDLIARRPGANLLIQPLLHAKYFRIDGSCLVGSANLTNKALGWSMPSNMELVVELSSDTSPLAEFEHTLLSTAISATQALKEEVAAAASMMEKDGLRYIADELNAEGKSASITSQHWFPKCKKPELLYQIYSEQKLDQIINWTLETGKQDISALRIPIGLSESNFNEYVVALMRQSPIVQKLSTEANEPITPDKGQRLITSYISEDHPDYDVAHQWEALKAWLLFFMHKEYRQPSGTFDIQKGAEITRINF